MNEDLISRKALRRKLIDRQITTVFYDNAKRHEVGCIIEMLDNAPAVNAEKVFKQIGLVKEAFEMAKADLMQVVQCKDCLHRETTKCPLCIVEFSELPDGKLHKHVIHNFVEDDFWCKKGERRIDDAD